MTLWLAPKDLRAPVTVTMVILYKTTIPLGGLKVVEVDLRGFKN